MQLFTRQNETVKLVELCRKGNAKAQYALYKLYSRAMYNTALRIVGSREEAEDVLQEAFLDGFMKIDYYRGDATFGAWLKSIVINKSIARLRSRRLHFEDAGSLDAQPADEEDDFEENEHTIQILKMLLNELPSGYRLVLSLYLFEGYDHKEISTILGISEVTSRSQFIRAKQRLLELYKAKQ